MGFLCKLQRTGNKRNTTELVKPLMFFLLPEFLQRNKEFVESSAWKGPLDESWSPLLNAFNLLMDLSCCGVLNLCATLTPSPLQTNWHCDDLPADQISIASDIVLHPSCGDTISVIVSKQKYRDPLRVIETVCLTMSVDVLHLFAGSYAHRVVKSALLLNRSVATSRQESWLVPICTTSKSF